MNLIEHNYTVKALYLFLFIVQCEIFVGFYVYYEVVQNVFRQQINLKSNFDCCNKVVVETTSNSDGVLLRKKRDRFGDGLDKFLNAATKIDSILKHSDTKLGPVGPPGPPGPPGLPGAPGPAGLPGQKGEYGHVGLPGVPGETGFAGSPGLSGIRGPPGIDGLPGFPGQKGDKGERGDSGMPGIPGLNGNHGSRGEKGEKGDLGLTGFPGITGAPGTFGERGPPGLPGSPGRCDVESLLQKTDLRIRKFGSNTYEGVPPRNNSCLLYLANTSYSKVVDYSKGKLLKDLYLTQQPDNTVWSVDYDNLLLEEFKNEQNYWANNTDKTYDLYSALESNAYAIYNKCLYSTVGQKKPSIIKLQLYNETTTKLPVSEITLDSLKSLYKSGKNYLDITVDDNGMWVILPVPKITNTAILKLNTNSMSTQYVWNVTLDHRQYSKMFIVSGTLYAINVTEDAITIPVAVDLYANQYYDLDVYIPKPSPNTLEVKFNAKEFQLQVWDSEYRYNYPLHCMKLDTNLFYDIGVE